jgi:hypothetical protein
MLGHSKHTHLSEFGTSHYELSRVKIITLSTQITDLLVQISLAFPITRAAILFKSASTNGKTSADPTNYKIKKFPSQQQIN